MCVCVCVCAHACVCASYTICSTLGASFASCAPLAHNVCACVCACLHAGFRRFFRVQPTHHQSTVRHPGRTHTLTGANIVTLRDISDRVSECVGAVNARKHACMSPAEAPLPYSTHIYIHTRTTIIYVYIYRANFVRYLNSLVFACMHGVHYTNSFRCQCTIVYTCHSIRVRPSAFM